MLNERLLPKYFCANVVNTTSHVINRALIIPILKKTSYELYKRKKLVISRLKGFGCKCFILNNGKEKIGKFDAKVDDEIFLSHASNNHAYRVCYKRLMIVEEYMLYLINLIQNCKIKCLLMLMRTM